MAASLLAIAAGLALLYAGGEALVRGAVGLGLRLGLSPLVMGLTLVSFGTGAPELAVCVDASLRDVGEIALGNVVGSNICNIALVLGLAALVRPLAVDARVVRYDVPIGAGAALLVMALLVDGELSRVDGALLGVALTAYLVLRLRMGRLDERRGSVPPVGELPAPAPRLGIPVLAAMAGLAALVAGARVFVDGAVGLASALGVTPGLIALSVVAAGTSLPELATSMVAAMRSHGDLAVGNVVGSNVFNALGILGASSLARPLARGSVQWGDLGIMLALACVILPLMRSGARLDRREGAGLLLAYAGYLYWLSRAL